MQFFRENLQQLSDWLHEVNFSVCLILELSCDVIDLISFGLELVNVVAVFVSSYPHDGNGRILFYDKKYFVVDFYERKVLLIELPECLLGLLAFEVEW
jgi:hypothetical protein